MAGIQLSGLASGLDTASIIDSLMAVERQPRTRIEMRQASEQARRDGLNQVTTQLKTLQDAATALRSAGTWADTQTATSSDTTKLAVTRTGGAGPGGYDIAVSRLASSTQRTYAYAPPAAGTNLTFTVKDAQGADVPTTIPIAAGASLDDAVSAINTTAGSPVYAVNVSGKLVLASRATGENARFTMADSAGGTLTQQSERLGQKALITRRRRRLRLRDEHRHRRDPGRLADAQGRHRLRPGRRRRSRPRPERALGQGQGVHGRLQHGRRLDPRQGQREAGRAAATTAAQAKTGALYGDAGLNGILRQLRQAVSDPVAGNATALNEMAELGVSTGAGVVGDQRRLGRRQAQLRPREAHRALAADPLAVRKLLGGITGTDGFAQRIQGILDPSSGTAGVLSQRISSEDSTLSGIANDLIAFDTRMTQKQDALNKQWSALETALQKARAASDISGLISSS